MFLHSTNDVTSKCYYTSVISFLLNGFITFLRRGLCDKNKYVFYCRHEEENKPIPQALQQALDFMTSAMKKSEENLKNIVVSGRSLFALEIKTKYDCFQIT
jgi:hypothetical protein